MSEEDLDRGYDYSQAEKRLRARAADAFRYERPEAAQRPTVQRFQFTPAQREAVENAKKTLEEHVSRKLSTDTP